MKLAEDAGMSDAVGKGFAPNLLGSRVAGVEAAAELAIGTGGFFERRAGRTCMPLSERRGKQVSSATSAGRRRLYLRGEPAGGMLQGGPHHGLDGVLFPFGGGCFRLQGLLP